jgi:hypothetical protein
MRSVVYFVRQLMFADYTCAHLTLIIICIMAQDGLVRYQYPITVYSYRWTQFYHHKQLGTWVGYQSSPFNSLRASTINRSVAHLFDPGTVTVGVESKTNEKL